MMNVDREKITAKSLAKVARTFVFVCFKVILDEIVKVTYPAHRYSVVRKVSGRLQSEP
jgi:hypothetical protein